MLSQFSKEWIARLLIVFGIVFGIAAVPASATASHEKYPLLSLYFVDCCFTTAEAEKIAQFDLVILTMEAQEYNPRGIERLRKLNPEIAILPYVPSQGIDTNYPSTTRRKLLDRVQSDWWMIRPGGARISRYPGEYGLNLTRSDVRYAIADFVGDLNSARCGSVHCWDGVFYDVVEDNLDYLGPLDLNRDGYADHDVNTQWVNAYRDLFAKTRSRIGDNKRIIINGVSNESVQGDINGRMFEHFPTPWHSDGSWSGVTGNIPTLQRLNMHPTGIILSGQGSEKDFRRMRMTIVSGMITGTFAGYDNGVDRHNSIWIYDEYKSSLGKATSRAVNLLDKKNTTWKAGVWQREFENGIAVLNTTNKRRTVQLEGGFEHLRGTQDPKMNSGEFTGSVTLEPNDGVVLLRRLRQIDRAPYLNGSFAAVYSNRGKKSRTSFFPSDHRYPGGSTVTHIDNERTIVADRTYVYYYKNGKRLTKFAPYGKSFKGGINIDVSRLTNPARGKKKPPLRIVTGTKSGGMHVRIFDMKGKSIGGCFPFGSNTKGSGISVAVGDVLRKNGGKEIVVGVAQGGSSRVKILNKKCQVVHGGFTPFGKSQHGVSLAVGEISRGKRGDEIVVMQGPGGPAEVKVYYERTSRRFKSLVSKFRTFSSKKISGAGVTIADMNHDGKNEIIPMTYDIFDF